MDKSEILSKLNVLVHIIEKNQPISRSYFSCQLREISDSIENLKEE